MFIDTHCHVHEAEYPLDREGVIARAHAADVDAMICVGTSEQSSREAVTFAVGRDDVFATVGVHPHETKDGWGEVTTLLAGGRITGTVYSENGFAAGLTRAPAPGQSRAADVFLNKYAQQSSTALRRDKIVAIGEIGLDYFYTHSPRETQIRALEEQIDLALKYDLPVIFHVREAFDDFWPILDNFHGLRGELHSFTDTAVHLEEGLRRGLYVGVNGISTFTKDKSQQAMFASIPLNRLLLETDAPFLTPAPFRGKVNEPAFVRNVAEFQASLRGVDLTEIARTTTANATALFAL
jgi:TatD DNase family protein